MNPFDQFAGSLQAALPPQPARSDNASFAASTQPPPQQQQQQQQQQLQPQQFNLMAQPTPEKKPIMNAPNAMPPQGGGGMYGQPPPPGGMYGQQQQQMMMPTNSMMGGFGMNGSVPPTPQGGMNGMGMGASNGFGGAPVPQLANEPAPMGGPNPMAGALVPSAAPSNPYALGPPPAAPAANPFGAPAPPPALQQQPSEQQLMANPFGAPAPGPPPAYGAPAPQLQQQPQQPLSNAMVPSPYGAPPPGPPPAQLQQAPPPPAAAAPQSNPMMAMDPFSAAPPPAAAAHQPQLAADPWGAPAPPPAPQQQQQFSSSALVPSSAPPGNDPFGIFGPGGGGAPAALPPSTTLPPSQYGVPSSGASVAPSVAPSMGGSSAIGAPPSVNPGMGGTMAGYPPAPMPAPAAHQPPPPAPAGDDPWAEMGFGSAVAPAPAPPQQQPPAPAVPSGPVPGEDDDLFGSALQPTRDDDKHARGAAVPEPEKKPKSSSSGKRKKGELPPGGEWYDAKIFTPTLGVMFFKPKELVDSLFLQTDKKMVDALEERPVVAFIVEGSSARSAGVELGHVLLKVNGIDVKNPKEASRLIKEGPRPLPLLFYVPETSVVVAEGEHMVKYNTKETGAPNSAKDWKPKYCVIGGIIAQPWMMNMYRSKSEYDIAVIETQARRPVSVKVKQFSLQGARIQNDWQGPQMVKYKNKLHPWKYLVILPISRNPIKIASPNLSQLKPVHEGIRRVLMAQQRDRGGGGGGGGGYRNEGNYRSDDRRPDGYRGDERGGGYDGRGGGHDGRGGGHDGRGGGYDTRDHHSRNGGGGGGGGGQRSPNAYYGGRPNY